MSSLRSAARVILACSAEPARLIAAAPETAQRLVLEQGKRLTVTGVTEVLRFDETTVLLRLTDRLLTVRGRGLELKQLLPEKGSVEILGRVDAVYYGDAPERGGLLRRMFG